MNQESRILRLRSGQVMNHGEQKSIINSIIHDSCFMILSRGFTLIELLVVIAVFAILSAGILTIININSQIDKAKLAKSKKFSVGLQNGLAISQVGKWSFEGTADDTSGYANNGTLFGDAGFETPTNCGIGFGQCLKLDGNGDYIDFGNKSILKPTGSVTLSAWFKYTTSVISRPHIFSNWWVGGWRGINLGIRTILGSYRFTFTIGPGVDPNSGNNYADAGGYYNDGIWHHVVGVYDKANLRIKIFIDGVQKDNKATDAVGLIGYDTDTSGSVSIGAVDVEGSPIRFWNGFIDEVAIYNQALTLSQVRHLFAQGLVKLLLAYR